jgi:hypothetical protein
MRGVFLKRRRILRTILVFITLGAGLDPVLLRAQTPVNNPLKTFEMEIQDFQQQIGIWERQAHTQIALVVAVVIFGALISAFQGSAKKWSKAATLVLGIATSICTGVNSQVFSADYRSLQHAAIEGQNVVRKLRNIIANFDAAHPTGENLKEFKSEFAKSVDDFNQISKILEGNTSAQGLAKGGGQAAFSLVVPSVYAQSISSAPEWINKLPSDSRSFYFVGTASDTSLSNAKISSLNDAIGRASSALMPGEPYNSGASVKAPVKDAASVQDTYFSYDKKSAVYNYYTLVRLSREIQDIRPALTVYQQKNWRPVDLTFHPDGGLFVLDAEGGVSRVRIDQRGIHLETLFRIKGADRPAVLAANAESVFASSNNSIGCTVYRFSLADKVTSQRLFAVGGGGCDGMAADGNTLYLVFPGKKEIRYWTDWGSKFSKSWSFNQINQGGVLTFDSRGGRLLYADGSGTAYAISVPGGEIQPLISHVGVVHSIATGPDYLLMASGKKVLYYSRSDNHGENPPSNLQSLPGGIITGLAIDSTDGVWLTDIDNGLIKGPYSRK